MPEVMEWSQIAGGLFYCAWGCIGIYAAKSLHDLVDSNQELNVKIAVVIEKLGSHERRIERLEESD